MHALNSRGVCFMFCIVLSAAATSAQAQWTQWGGPNRDFIGDAENLADAWPEDGPRRIWKRKLGFGYSSVLCDGDMLFTMYRNAITDETEYFVALSARTGETVWEHANKAPLLEEPDQRWGGQGPNSTPLIIGERLYAVGSRNVLHCFNKKTGKLHWKRDLEKDYGAATDKHCGYCPSPIAYEKTIILAVGKPAPEEGAQGDREQADVPLETRTRVDGHALMAFDQKTGELAWKNMDFAVDFSSPLIINFDGQAQLVFSSPDGLFGANPTNGDLLWHFPKRGGIITPLWNGRDILFYGTTDRNKGAAVKLTKQDGKTVPTELWSNKKIRCALATPVRIGDHMVCANDNILLGVDFNTGKRTWAKRGYTSPVLVYGGGKLILLDEGGRLTLAETSPERLNVLANFQATEKYSCTAPTLVGQTLYVRDRKHIMALDLSPTQQARAD